MWMVSSVKQNLFINVKAVPQKAGQEISNFFSECQLEMRAARQRRPAGSEVGIYRQGDVQKKEGNEPKRREAETLPVDWSDLWLLGA